MMATIATVADVLEAVETDFPDNVIERLLETAEEDIREYSTSRQRNTLPVVVTDVDFVILPGVPDQVWTLPSAVGAYPIVRFEGTVGANADPFTADTTYLTTAGAGTGTITPVTAAGPVAGGAFVVTADADRMELTIDATLATEPVTITRLVGLCTVEPPTVMVSAVIDLVKLALEYDIVRAERTGQFSETKNDYHDERFKVLKRLVYASKGSLVA